MYNFPSPKLLLTANQYQLSLQVFIELLVEAVQHETILKFDNRESVENRKIPKFYL